MTTLELLAYYANLLILQYHGKARAIATIRAAVNPFIEPQTSIQTITFATAPTAGAFVLSYGGVSSASISWNDPASTIQTKLRAITGLSAVDVTGSISSLTVTVTFTGVDPVADLLVLVSNTLVDSMSAPVTPAVTETDVILPLAVQDAFNLNAPNLAQGVQLDTLGKYVGVTRSGNGFVAPITLDDSDFTSLIRMAIARNNAGSSLADIQQIMFQNFGNAITVYDLKNMHMDFFISSTVGSQDLIQLFITEGLLPIPMAVGALIIYFPVIDSFFSFRTYEAPAFSGTPFNSYSDYQTDWPWLSYANAYVV